MAVISYCLWVTHKIPLTVENYCAVQYTLQYNKVKLFYFICSVLSFSVKHNLTSFQSDISHQFETLLNEVNSQKEIMTDLEERVKKV